MIREAQDTSLYTYAWRPSYARSVSLAYILQLNVVNFIALLQVDAVSSRAVDSMYMFMVATLTG